jgi:hypothetical protein
MLESGARILAFLLSTLFGASAWAQEAKDMHLEDVGFVMRPANAPEQLARLRLLPPRQFVARTKDGRRYYLYADPDFCKCLFLGNEAAMTSYRDLVSPPPQLPATGGPSGSFASNVIIQDMDADMSGSIVEGDILDYPP